MSHNEETPDSMRSEIFAIAKRYFAATHAPKPFQPGKTSLPANGKVLSDGDLVSLLDASLDLWLTTGRHADRFEADFARAVGARYSLFVNSGSSANLLAFSAITSPLLKDRQVKPGDEFITPACGFPTTVNPALQYGMRPVFIDVDLGIHNITPELVEAAWTPKTRLVMAAHTLGNPYDAQRISDFCKQKGIWFIEDCCDALGAKLGGKAVGTFGDLSTCSFYPAHHITTGEGGAVATSSPSLKKIAESFRDWGRDCYCPPGKENTCQKRYGWQMGDLPAGYDHKYIYSHIGYNLKATDMQAALGVSQLKKLDEFVARRVTNFQTMSRALQELGAEEFLETPTTVPGAEPSWFGFLITLKDGGLDRSLLLKWLGDRGIGTRLLFGGNLTKQPGYKTIDFRISGSLANTDRVMRSSFYVGIWPGLTEEMIRYIAESIVTGFKAVYR